MERLRYTASDGLRLRPGGVEWFTRLGIDTAAAAMQRRAFCRPCMDWSERRQHLAGALGAAFLARLFELGWAKRCGRSRVIAFTPRGERAFRELLTNGPAVPAGSRVDQC